MLHTIQEVAEGNHSNGNLDTHLNAETEEAKDNGEKDPLKDSLDLLFRESIIFLVYQMVSEVEEVIG